MLGYPGQGFDDANQIALDSVAYDLILVSGHLVFASASWPGVSWVEPASLETGRALS